VTTEPTGGQSGDDLGAAPGPAADAAVGPVVGVTVRVPATSANLGPGFDAYGLGLGLHDEVEVTLRRSGLAVSAVGPDDVPDSEDNLLVRSVRAMFDTLGRPQPGLAVRAVNRVPHGRGLGSSAAAIVAGVTAAWHLDTAGFLAGDGSAAEPLPAAFDRAAALRVATAIEGHPDNVAAALFGGLTVAWTGADGPRAYRAEPVADLRPVAFVPAVRTSTKDSRGRLPERLTHADAAFSAGRAGLLALALTQGDGSMSASARAGLLLAATQDRLHQPYRLPVVPESAALVERLRAAGVPAVLSGSGPTVLALAVGGAQAATAVGVAAPGFAVLPLVVDRDGVRATPFTRR
jgi:homoserine kinase